MKESQQVGKFSFREKQISYMIISDDDSDSYLFITYCANFTPLICEIDKKKTDTCCQMFYSEQD
jgi:hypothetical protein